MKKLFKVMTLCLVVLLLAGCEMKMEYGINISKDKNVSIEILSAMDDEMIDAMIDMGDSFGSSESTESKKHTDKERWEFLEKDSSEKENYDNYKKEKYDKKGYKGYVYSLDLGSIENLVDASDKVVDLDSMDENSKMFKKDGDTYTLKIKVSDSDTQQMSQYGNSVKFDVKLRVTLPNKAKSNNATEVDGTTYIWDLTKAKSIDLTFDITGDGASNSSNNTTLIIGIAAGVVVVGAIAFVVLNKKKTA